MLVGYGGYCLASRRPIGVKKMYFNNTQPIDAIRDEIDPRNEKLGIKDLDFRFMRINWSPVDFHSKTLNNAAARITQFNYAPKTSTIDPFSISQKNKIVAKSKLLAIPDLKNLADSVGFSDEEALPVESPEDIDALQALGGIGTKAEINMRRAVKHSFVDCRYKEVLEPEFIKDLQTQNLMVAAIEIDVFTGRPAIKYIPVENAVLTASRYSDFRDLNTAGYVEKMPMKELRQYFYNEKQAGNTKYNDVEKVLGQIANKYRVLNGNYPLPESMGLQQYYDMYGSYPYDGMFTDVFTFYVVTSDLRTYLEKFAPSGYTYERVKNSTVLEEGETGTLDKNVIQNVYRIRWVIGTDYVFNVGIDDYIVRQGQSRNKRAIIPIVAYQSKRASMLDKIIPKIDDINKFEFKIRHLVNKMIPEPMMQIDQSLLEEYVTMNDIQYSVTDMLEAFERTGKFLIRTKNEFGVTDAGSQRKAVEFIEQPAVQKIIELTQAKNLLIQEIKDMIGVNDIADGTQTSAELLVGVTEASYQAVNNALLPEIQAYKAFMTGLGNMIMRKYEVMLKQGKEISGVYVDAGVAHEYKISEDLLSDTTEWGFYLEMGMTEAQKQDMLAELANANAKGIISMADMMVCKDLIMNDDIKAAQYYMAKSEQKANEMSHQQQMQITTAQAQAQGDSAVKAEQAKSTNQIAINDHQNQFELQKLAKEHEYKMAEIDKQNLNESRHKEIDRVDDATQSILEHGLKQGENQNVI